MATIDIPQELLDRIGALRRAQELDIHDVLAVQVDDPVVGDAPEPPPWPTDHEVIDAAVKLLEVHWVRDEHDTPEVPKHPFQKLFSQVPADPQVRQRTAKEFDLTEPFVYTGERFDNDRERPTWVVAGTPESTDFASIPGFLTWLIPRYGRHTMAALIHDHLQDLLVEDPETEPVRNDQRTVTSTQADYIMRIAMRDSGVPFVLRWIVWTGISMRTLVTKPFNRYYAAVVGLWVLLYGVGVGVVGLGWLLTAPLIRLSGGEPWTVPPLVIGLVLLSPLVLSALWSPRWGTGAIAAYVVMVVAMPVAFIFVARSVYWLAEAIAKLRPKTALPVGDDLVIFDHNPISEAKWKEQRPERDQRLNQLSAGTTDATADTAPPSDTGADDGVVIDLDATTSAEHRA